MKIIIVGLGKVGYYLSKTLLKKGHNISVIDKVEKRCKRVSEELDILILSGDGTNTHVLSDAGADTADVLAAVTGSDEENLVICQMAKRKFGIDKTVARINNPKNEKLFKTLGVDMTISSTSLIAKSIELEMEAQEIKTLLSFNRGDMVIIEMDIDSSSPVAGRNIKTIAEKLPHDSVFVAIFRGEKVVYPRGHVQLKDGDKLIAFTAIENQKKLKDIILGIR